MEFGPEWWKAQLSHVKSVSIVGVELQLTVCLTAFVLLMIQLISDCEFIIKLKHILLRELSGKFTTHINPLQLIINMLITQPKKTAQSLEPLLQLLDHFGITCIFYCYFPKVDRGVGCLNNR